MLRAVRMVGSRVTVAMVLLAGCGGQQTRVSRLIGPTGDELCLAERRVCVVVPPKALTKEVVLALAPATNEPGGAVGDGAMLTVDGASDVVFSVPVEVQFSLDALPVEAQGNESLLKVHALGRDDVDWSALDNSTVDRVRRALTGLSSRAVTFVVLRADRLSDGGTPMEGVITKPDASVIVVPPIPDAGRRDAGVRDSGVADAGVADAGALDAGVRDAGVPDAGVADAGAPDAGMRDAGIPDAGALDAGVRDAGTLDAGPLDSGVTDAGAVDAGSDAGSPDAGVPVDAGVDAGADSGTPDAG